MKKYFLIALIAVVAIVVVACGNTDDKADDNTSSQQPQEQAPPGQSPPADVGPPTVLEDGTTPEEHVSEYFDAYKAQKLEEAFDMQPAETKAKQSKEEFLSLRKGMPIDDYKILPTEEQGNQKTIAVEYAIGQYGTWISTWLFEKEDGKWTAVRYTASPKG